jgi:hypothetical protein
MGWSQQPAPRFNHPRCVTAVISLTMPPSNVILVIPPALSCSRKCLQEKDEAALLRFARSRPRKLEAAAGGDGLKLKPRLLPRPGRAIR